MRRAAETVWPRGLESSLLLGNVEEEKCPLRYLYLETQPTVHDHHANHLLSTAISTLSLTDEGKTEDRVRTYFEIFAIVIVVIERK